jgi:polygalacturonase
VQNAFSAAPTLPAINTNNVFNVTNVAYGAVGDGVATNTAAVQNAIIAAATASGGGTVEIPPGIFICGPLNFSNYVNLQIDAGAVLRLLPIDQYPGGAVGPAPFLSATSLHDLEVSGSGAIDGQGAPWWPGYKTNSRPPIISFSKCSRILIQDITISNPPVNHIAVKGNNAGNVTIQRITELAPPSTGTGSLSHNTDGIDLAETNAVIRDCVISTGDDNVAMGSSAGVSRDILITNCIFGSGHGVSLGSYTSSGVSNLTVINCIFTNTDNGIRMKSDNDRGGLAQNLSYLNLNMTNVQMPFVIYSYYNNSAYSPNSVTAAQAASLGAAAVSSTTPTWRNVLISNVTAIGASGYPAGTIWSRIELPATNFVFDHVSVTASKSFNVFSGYGIQFVDSQVTVPASVKSFTLFNSQLIVSNRTASANLVTIDGLTTNGYGNALEFYNTQASLSNTNVLDDGPVTVGASTLTVNNNYTVFPSTVLTFLLGTNASQIVDSGNLTLGGTINLASGAGFGPGTNVLMTCSGNLTGLMPALGAAPAGYSYLLDTNTLRQLRVAVIPPVPPAPANLTAVGSNALVRLNWSAAAGATSYNVQRAMVSHGPYTVLTSGVAATNYADPTVTNGVTYFYVVSGSNAGGTGPNSPETSATPGPALTPVSVTLQTSADALGLSWPIDHTGWRLEIQTNANSAGLSASWSTWPNSQQTNRVLVPIDPANGSVFLRLVYP